MAPAPRRPRAPRAPRGRAGAGARSGLRVCVRIRLPEPVEAELARSFEVTDEPRGADGIVTTPLDPVDGPFLDSVGPQLRIVAQYAVGLDNLDLEAARARGVVVTSTPDVLTEATAELTIGLLLALVRRIAEGDRLLRARGPWLWGPTFMLGIGLGGKALGIVGMGRIGRAVARLAEAHGMEVRDARGLAGLEELDVLSLHCPLTPETHHLIDERALVRMRPSAVLVNTARGAIVDEAALVRALRDGTIAGAALDVYEHEPDVPGELLALDNVVVAPHLGSATVEARVAMGMLCVEALRAVLLEGRVPANAVV